MAHDYSMFEMAFDDDAAGLAAAIANGRDPNETHPIAGHSVLQMATSADAMLAMRALLEAGADPNLRFTWRSMMSDAVNINRVALHSARCADAVDILCAAGADIDAADGEGWTLLSIATRHAMFELVDHLLAVGASRALRGAVLSRHQSLEGLCASELDFWRSLPPESKILERIGMQEQMALRLAAG
jgi:hypothetical protein